MITRSTHKQVNEASQEIGGDVFLLTDEAVSNEKLKEGIDVKEEDKLEVKAIEEISSSSCDEIEVLFDKKKEVHSVKAVETTVIVNKEDKQSQQFHSPIFNIHIHVSPPNNDSSSVPNNVQPIIHLHFDENTKKRAIESLSSQNGMIERTVQSFLSMTSTDSGNITTDFSNTSVIKTNIKEKNYTSPNQNGTDVDMSELSNNTSNKISTECHARNVIQKQVPEVNIFTVEAPTSKKQHEHCDKNSNSSDQDKDFESVIPKLQEKLDNLIKRNIENTNTRSNNKVKEKTNSTKSKHSMDYHEDSRTSRQLRSNSSNEPKKHEEPRGIVDTEEIIVLSDSDSPSEISNKEEIVEGKKKEKRKSNVKSTRTSQSREEVKDADSSEDEGGRYNLRKPKTVTTYVELRKQGRLKPRGVRGRKCKAPTREQLKNWVTKVAFAKACDLQPTVFAEKEILVKPPVESNKRHNSKSTSQNSLASVKRNEKIQQDDSIASCETPKRYSSYQHVRKRLSKETTDVESSRKAVRSPNKRQGNKYQVSDSEGERDEEISKSRKAQELRNKSDTSLVSVNNNEETQQNGSLFSCLTPGRLTYGCQSLPSGFAVKEKSPADSRKAQGSKNKSETSSVGVINDDEIEQNDSLVACETLKRFSNASQFQPAVFGEKGVFEKSPVNSKTPQELKNIWQTAFASVDKKKEPQQNGSLGSCQTSKKISFQHPHKYWSREDVESTPNVFGSPNNNQESNNQVSDSGNERNDEVICTSPPSPNREESLESANNKRYMTLLAEGCNFSEILLKFREKHYKDMAKVLFPDKTGSNNNHIPKDSICSAKESASEDELGDVSNVLTVKQKKAKERSDIFINDNKADEYSNPFLSPKEPDKCFLSPTETPLQKTHTSVSPQGKESHNETISSVIHVSVISHSNEIHLYNEKNLNHDGGNVFGSKNFETITGGMTVNESCYNSSSTGNGTTPEKTIVVEKSSYENHEFVNEFRVIKKKLRVESNNNVKKPVVEKKNDILLESLRKNLLTMCMARDSSDSNQPEETDPELTTKRKGSPEAPNLDMSPPSEKKMKQSKRRKRNSRKRQSSRKKVSSDEEYIPLNAPGPTKFAVAPLDKVTPYREHEANDFKANLLYGKGVKRYESPKSHETYKSKQRARKESSY